MKAIFLTLASIVFSLNLSAQASENQHLLFKGVPIDGTLNEYVAKMNLNGFIVMSSESGTAVLQGDFAGYKNCEISIITLKGKDLVNRITVLLPEDTEWSTLSNNYNNLKEMLTRKYGSPSRTSENWLIRSEPALSMKMFYIGTDQCNYVTSFETPSGTIKLKIDHSGYDCFVSMSYFDKINGEIMKAKAIDDL